MTPIYRILSDLTNRQVIQMLEHLRIRGRYPFIIHNPHELIEPETEIHNDEQMKDYIQGWKDDMKDEMPEGN